MAARRAEKGGLLSTSTAPSATLFSNILQTKHVKKIDFYDAKGWIGNMKKEKNDFKDMLWGMLWVGWIVVPILYVILAKEKTGRLQR
jgi:hypothetical protein